MRIRMVVCVAAVLATAAVGNAIAGEPEAAPAASTAAAAPAPATEDGDANASPWCLTATGSHIPVKDGECVPAAPGRVITRDEIQKSGATSVSDAVRRLSLH